MAFKRGNDVLTTIGVGGIEVLKKGLLELNENVAVYWTRADHHTLITDFAEHDSIAISVSIDFDQTPCETVEAFITQFLPPHFFIAAQIVKDGDAQKTVRLQLHPKYVDSFPKGIIPEMGLPHFK